MQPIGEFLTGYRLKLANLQDFVLEIIYDKIDPTALLYGDTAIWRCYGGQRFSEDIDIYMRSDLLEEFINSLPKYGLKLTWRNDEFPSNVRIDNRDTSLLLESKEGNAESIIKPYFRVDGSPMTIGVLSPTELLTRKIEAYNGRRLIRDIYDIYILTRYLNPNDYTVKTRLSGFFNNIIAPFDEGILSSLIYSGNSKLNFSLMLKYITGWLNEI
jgi:predicted nucleotidyltransferase component of viral defense system